MEVLWLSQADVAGLDISMSEVMEVVERGLAALGDGKGEMPSKIGVHPRKDCFLHAMPCYLGGDIDLAGVKCVAGYPPNQAKGLPYINGVYVLFDSATGQVVSIMDANWITAWRTGAASGVVAKYMADPETETITVSGLGVQGRVNLMALAEVLPKLREVKIYDPFQPQVEKYAVEMAGLFPKLTFTPCAELKAAVAGAGVVVTCTPIVENPERPIKASWLEPDVFALAVDYDASFDSEVMAKADAFVVDDEGQYLTTQAGGGYFQNGYPGKGAIHADAGKLCAKKVPGVTKGRRGAVLMGIASHDVMTAGLIFNRAEERGAGVTLAL